MKKDEEKTASNQQVKSRWGNERNLELRRIETYLDGDSGT